MTGARLGGKKIPERSEDDFFPANQPDRAALHSQWQRAIFAVRNEIMVYIIRSIIYNPILLLTIFMLSFRFLSMTLA